MSNCYIVRMAPLDSYFLGGETTFGEGSEPNYYVVSNKLPQVSTLLGVIRYELLRQRGLLSYSDSQAEMVKKVIGDQGFNLETQSLSLGIIKKMSPLFLEKNGTFYTPMPLDYGIDAVAKTEDHVECSFSSACNFNYLSLPKYNCKNYSNYKYWISGDGNEKVLGNDIFKMKEQIGILSQNRDDDKNGFYKMQSIVLAKGYRFAFLLETSEDIETVENRQVFMGGNRSMFNMSIESIENIEELKNMKNIDGFCQKYFEALHKDGRLLLLGDAYFSDKECDELPFFWAMRVINKYLLPRYTAQGGMSWKRPNKTATYSLLGRGGVIYERETPKCNKELQTVGLNVFI